MEEVLSVLVERDLLSKAVVFGSQEQTDDDILGGFAVNVSAHAEDLVVQTGVLHNHTLAIDEVLD